MFSEEFVCPPRGGGVGRPLSPSGQRSLSRQRPPLDTDPLVLTCSGGHCSGRMHPTGMQSCLECGCWPTSVQTPTGIQHSLNPFVGPFYTERQHQCSDDTSNTTLIEHNGLVPELGLQLIFYRLPLFSTRAVLLASSQHCRNFDADAQCKHTFTIYISNLSLLIHLCVKFII